jgi:hypothetical protein
MKFLLEKLRATIGIAEILGGIAARADLHAHRAALKGSVQVGDPLPVGMIERFRDAKNGRKPANHALIVVIQRSIRDVMAGGIRFPIMVTDHRGHHSTVSALQTRNVSIERKVFAMLVVAAMADHVTNIVEQ